MSDNGIVRKFDNLGRVTIPSEFRTSLGLGPGVPVSISLEGGQVIISKHQDSCAICGDSERDQRTVKGRPVCSDCVNKITGRRGL